jgi:WD40 repeat protein
MSEPGGGGDAFTFSAFISYARANRADAVGLQRRLEQYRLDADLRVVEGERPLPTRPLQPVFRDEDELVPGQDLPERIRRGLQASRFLIVLASRAAVQSQWVEKEILDFMALGKAHRIIVLVIDGEPNAVRSGKAAELECLPRPFRLKRADGRFSDEATVEPNWVDWRGRRENDRINFLRLVAALLELDRFDDLIRRDARAERRRLRVFQAVSAVFVAVGLAAVAGGLLAATQLNEVRKTESRFLARVADDLAEPGGDAMAGDHARALQVAIEGAPTVSGALFSRPLVVETEAALRRSVTHLRLARAFPHDAQARAAAISPDGKRLVTLSSGAPLNPHTTVRVWDLALRKLIAAPAFIESSYNATQFSVAFSADGGRFAAVGGDHVQVFESASGKAVGAAISFDFTDVASAELSADGGLVLIKTDGGEKSLWDSHTGRRIISSVYTANNDLTRVVQETETTLQLIDVMSGARLGPPIPYQLAMVAAGFSSDGKRLMVIGLDKCSVYDGSSGARLASWAVPSIVHAEFNASGTHVITAADTAGGGGEARWWDAASGAGVGQPMRQPEAVGQMVLSPDGRLIATHAPGIVRVWDAATAKETQGSPVRYGGDRLARIVFNGAGTQLLTITDARLTFWSVKVSLRPGDPIVRFDDEREVVVSPKADRLILYGGSEARLFDLETGVFVDTFKHDETINAVAFARDGVVVLSAADDRSVRIWDVRATTRPAVTMSHGADVRGVAVSPDGTLVATGAEDGTARLWNAQSGESVGQPMVQGSFVDRLQFGAGGTRLLSVAADARLWKVPTGEAIGPSLSNERAAKDAVFSADGKRVAVASDDGMVRVWDAASGAPVGEPLKHRASVNRVRFGRGDELLLTVSGEEDAPGEVRIWDMATFKQIGVVLPHAALPEAASFSPKGDLVVTSPEDGILQLSDPQSGKAVGPRLKHPAKVVTAQFSNDGRRLLMMSIGEFDFSGRGHLWDVASGALIAVMEGSSLTTARFSHDGTRIATGDWSGSVRLWDGVTGRLIRVTPHRRDAPISAGVFSDDGRFLISSGLGLTRVWDARTGASVGVPLAGNLDERSSTWAAAHGRIVTNDGRVVRSWDVRDWTDDGAGLVTRACAALDAIGIGPLPLKLRERAFRREVSAPCAERGLLDWRYYVEALPTAP